MEIGFIGLGSMGAGIVSRLQKAGHTVLGGTAPKRKPRR
jgi:3-hydroxyisobutyrate dehydrogenase-like beta-hydroxyacid dehydrogenase